jgi:hypothetical protein
MISYREINEITHFNACGRGTSFKVNETPIQVSRCRESRGDAPPHGSYPVSFADSNSP